MYTPQQIQQATGAPLQNIQVQWPLVVEALKWAGIDSHLVRVGAVATIARETGQFWPIEEYGGQAYWESELGADWPWHGRGLIQLTWKEEYAHYGAELGVDLVDNPALAMRNDLSARVLALYFRERGTAAYANAENWDGVQTSVNGGYVNYTSIFLPVLNRILAIPEPPDPRPTPRTVVAVRTQLRSQPKDRPPDALDPHRQMVVLQVGQQVLFTPDPAADQWHGQETTTHFAHVSLPGSPVHGWVLRRFLRTEYVVA